MFDRPIAPTGYIPELDGLRGLAILIVLVWHAALRVERYRDIQAVHSPGLSSQLGLPNYLPYFPHGEVGVALFFVLSGFVIAPSLAIRHRQPGWVLTFYRRRFWRIYPPYAVTLVLCWAIVTVVGSTRHVGSDTLLYSLVLGLGYANGIVRDAPSPFNPPMWSLEVEAQFYLLAPLIALALGSVGRSASWLLAVAAMLCLVASAMLASSVNFDGRFRFGLLAHAHLFLIGIYLRERYRGTTDHRHTIQGSGFDVLFLVGLIGLYWIGLTITKVDTRFGGGWPDIVAKLSLAVALVATFVGSLYGGRARTILSLPAVRLIGILSFSIYLTHIVVMEGLQRALPLLSGFSSTPELYSVWISTLCGSSIAIGLVFYSVVERPLRQASGIGAMSAVMATLVRIR